MLRPDTKGTKEQTQGAKPRTLGSMLDPQGIYGTRTAYRVRMARRRRATQSAVVGFSFLALVVAIFVYLRVPRVPTITSDWQSDLMTSLVSLPVAAKSREGNVLLVPTESGNLLLVDLQQRTVQPSFDTAFPLRAQPLVVKDIVFVPCQDGALYAVTWRTGKLLWTRKTASAMTTRPAYANVLLPSTPSSGAASSAANQAGTQPTGTAIPRATSSGASQPVAQMAGMNTARPLTGTLAQSVVSVRGSAVAGTQSMAPSAPPQPEPLVFAGNDEGTVIALDADNGQLQWKRIATGPVGDGITATEDSRGQSRVLVPLLGGIASRGGLWCLDGKTGKPVWKFPQDTKTFAAQFAAPVVSLNSDNATEGRVFCFDDSGAVICLDLKTGNKIWKTFAQPLASAPRNTTVLLRGEPLLKLYSWGERLFTGGSDGGLRCYDARTGQLQWVFDTGATVRCRPQALRLDASSGAGDIILTGSDGPAMYALDASSGSVLWKYKTQGPAFAGPVVNNNQILTVTADGTIQTFPLTR